MDGPPPGADLLEREPERAALRAALAEAAAGRGALVVLDGPPGIGKTALLADAAATAAQLGLGVRRARAEELEGHVPYGVVRELLAGAGGAAAGALGAPAVASAPLGEEESAGVLLALHGALAELAARGPLALLVDDAQWADAASVRLLLHVAHRVGALPVALVVAARGGEARELVDRLLAAGPARHVRPAALGAQAVEAVLRARLGREPGRALRDACLRATGGVPLLVEELAAALAATGAGEDDEAAVRGVAALAPEGVTRSVALRLAAVSAPARRVARAAAVLGDGARLGEVAELAELGEGEAARGAAELVAAALLADAVPLAWRHPLLRTAALAGLSAPERAALHHAAARALDRRGAEVGRVAAQLAGQEATRDPWAAGVLRRAGHDAGLRGAPDVAAALLRRALDEAPEDRALRLELARAESRAGEAAGPARLLELLGEESDVPQRARLALEAADALMARGEHRAAAAALREVLRQDPGQELRLQLLAVLAVCERYAPSPDDAGAQQRLAAAVRGLAGATPGERYALAVDALTRPQRTAAALAATAAVVRRAWPDGLLPRAALGGAAVNLVHAYALDDAEAWLRRILDELRDAALPVAQVQAAAILGTCLRLRGALPEAERTLREGVATALDVDPAHARTVGAELALVLVERGRAEDAAAVLATCDPPGPVPVRMLDNVRLLARARLAEAEHRDADALAALLELGRRLHGWGLDRPLPPWRSAAAVLLARAGRNAEARRLAAEELEAARRWGGPEVLGIALRGVALAADPVDPVALEASVSVLERGVARLELARSLVELGAARRRARARCAAREPLERGLELAHRCGAAGLADRARTELLAAGARPRRAVRTGVEALTPSERRVAELAAAGRTNRQIAAELVVTPGTVETHLRHVFQKLDVRARRELAQKLTVAP